MKYKLNIKKLGVILGVLILSLVAPVIVFLTCYEFFLWTSAGFNKDYRKIIKCLDKTKGVWDYTTRTCLTETVPTKNHASDIKVVQNITEVISADKNLAPIDNKEQVKIDPNDLDRIFTQDDLCGLIAFQKNSLNSGSDRNVVDSMKYFYEHSDSRNSFEDLKLAFAGKPAKTLIGQYYSNLVLAGLAFGSTVTYKGPIDYDQALEGFESLIEKEPGNGAPIVFAITTLSSAGKSIPPELLTQLEQATYFETYLLSLNKELSNANPPSATFYLMNIAYMSAMPIPDYLKIQARLKIVFQSRPDLKIKVADLMTLQGRNAKVGSDSAGFGVIEYAVGRGLYPKDQRPLNYNELNKKLGQHSGDELILFENLDSKCTSQLAEEVRDHAVRLRNEDRGLGMSL